MGQTDEQLADLTSAGRTLAQIAGTLGVDVATARRRLQSAGLATRQMKVRAANAAARATGEREVLRDCARHGRQTHRQDARGTFRCARCNGERVARRRRDIKRVLVEEAGGRCLLCGYDRCERALSFHHLDPATKEFNVAQHGHSRGLERARAEAAKCALLCANCHMEVESGLASIPLEFALERSGVAQLGRAAPC